MKKTKQLLALACLIVAGCHSPIQPTTVETSEGQFTLVRPEGPRSPDGSFEIELWKKEGIPANEKLFMRSVASNGRFHFRPVEP